MSIFSDLSGGCSISKAPRAGPSTSRTKSCPSQAELCTGRFSTCVAGPHRAERGCLAFPLHRRERAENGQKRSLDNVHTLRLGLDRTAVGPPRIAYVSGSPQCLQGLEPGSSPTLGTVFPQVRRVWSPRVCTNCVGWALRGPFFVGGRRPVASSLLACLVDAFGCLLPLHCRLRSLSWALRRIHASVAR